MTTLAISAKHQNQQAEVFSALLDLPSFFREAKCKGEDPSQFDGETVSAVHAAKQICNQCPVLEKCGKWATQTQSFGVWGAMTPAERNKKAKGMNVIDITELRLLDDGLKRLSSNAPIAELANEFKVTTRTIHRWRKKIFATQKAS